MMNSIEISKIKYRFTKLSMDIKSEVNNYNLKDKTSKSITNTLARCGVDNKGEIWIVKKKIFHILRNKSELDSNYEIRNIKERDKLVDEGELFINIAPIIEILVRKSVKNPNNDILKSIIEILNKVLFDPVVEGEREKYQRNLKLQLSILGKIRAEVKNIVNDELTNEPLDGKYEFHHIRVRSVVGNEVFELDIELGLVINKKTHKDITKESIKDEDELLVYCIEKGYNTEWYSKVKDEIEKYNH